MEGFLRYEFGGLIFGGAYTWRSMEGLIFGILRYKNIENFCRHYWLCGWQSKKFSVRRLIRTR